MAEKILLTCIFCDEEKDFCIDTIKHHFDKDKFFIKLSPINPNTTSDKNNLGNGVIEGVNLM